jgi:WD40-like Beta Propeller Repeat
VSSREQSPQHGKSSSNRTGAFAWLVGLPGIGGSGPPSNGRLRATLAALAVAIAAFALTAAPAGAAPPSTNMGAISAVSYGSAHVTGRVTSTGGVTGSTNYRFEYSKNPGTEGWTAGPGGALSGAKTNEAVEADITGLRGGTKYFVRLTASVFGPGFVLEEGASPEPSPSLTTLAVDPPENVSLSAPAELFSISAKLSGKVKRPANSNSSFDVKCRFEYVSDEQFQSTGFAGATLAPCEPSPVTEAGVEKVVTAKISGLTAATIYHQRLVAETGSPQIITTAATTFTTAPPVEKPKILAVSDTDVSYRSANLSGEIERPVDPDPALDFTCYFEVVSEEQFQATGFEEALAYRCDQNPENSSGGYTPISKTGISVVTKESLAPQLKSGVTYHYRLTAENAVGRESKTAASTFTTLPGGDPTFTIEPNPIVGYTSVELFGTADRGLGGDNDAQQFTFEFAKVGTEDWSGIVAGYREISKGPGLHHFSIELNNEHLCCGQALSPGTEYKYRLVVERQNGVVNVNYISETFPETPGPYPTFTTKSLAEPTIAFGPVTGVTANAAHFSGSVDTNAPGGTLDALGKAAYKTEWEFQCSPECPDPALSGTVQGEEGSKPISLDSTRLQPNTFYETKLIAHNNFYAVETPIQTFQTPLVAPTVTAAAGASDGQGGYFLEGFINSNNTKVTSCRFEYGTTATYPNTYEAPCLPNPSGPNEVQLIAVEATEGQFKLSFRGQTTSDLPFNATPGEVQTALRALSHIGSTGVNVSGTAQAYKVTFAGGGLAGANVEPIKSANGTTPLGGGAGVSVSTETEGGTNHAVSVEAHLEALTVGSTYHFRIFATSAGGAVSTVDRTFIPELASKETCSNEQLRKENNSLALPECRAYEAVSPPGKEGFNASFYTYDGGERVAYKSGAGNIAKSGQGQFALNSYVATRTAAGWETISDLNGSSGSVYDAPSNLDRNSGNPALPLRYSSNLLSSVWFGRRTGSSQSNYFLRGPNGIFTPIIGSAQPSTCCSSNIVTSDDLSHLFTVPAGDTGTPTFWSHGVNGFLGTGAGQPPRVDVDNSGSPITTCTYGTGASADLPFISNDGRVAVVSVVGGCGGANPPAQALWARVNSTTSFDVSASQCNRSAPACSAPAAATFAGAASDGSRVFFTTKQQLLDADTDETNDVYACDIPSGTPVPVGEANPCAPLDRISVAKTGAAEVENVLATSEDGSTVLFTAKGVLATNEDALKEQALAGDSNLYVWRQDSAHPTGQTTFVARLDTSKDPFGLRAQATPDGRYLVFTSASQLVEADTDSASDVYRLDADSGELIRVSTNVFGVGGNGPFDAEISHAAEHHPTTAISDDGQKIAFTSTEALSPADGNGEPDVYLWTPARVSLISTGAVGAGGRGAFITASANDIYFETTGALTPADADDLNDVYDARIDGGFGFAQDAPCSGEACQPGASSPPTPIPLASQGTGPGNPNQPKPCPTGKVLKHGKCVKKAKKHSGNKSHGKGKKHHGKTATHKQGGGK